MAAVAAAIPAGATEDDQRKAFRAAGGHRVADLATIQMAHDAEALSSSIHADEKATPQEPLGDVVRRIEREARRQSRG